MKLNITTKKFKIYKYPEYWATRQYVKTVLAENKKDAIQSIREVPGLGDANLEAIEILYDERFETYYKPCSEWCENLREKYARRGAYANTIAAQAADAWSRSWTPSQLMASVPEALRRFMEKRDAINRNIFEKIRYKLLNHRFEMNKKPSNEWNDFEKELGKFTLEELQKTNEQFLTKGSAVVVI